MTPRFVVIAAAILAWISVSAESFKRVTVTEDYNIPRNESQETAMEKALHLAKKKAMSKAGADIKIKNIDIEVTDYDKEGSGEYTNSLTTIEMMSVVRVVGEPKFTIEMRKNNMLYCVCELTAEVMTKRPEHDPAFKIEVSGVKAMYNEGDKMEFAIRPTLDCYVRIFWITDAVSGSGGLLYPMSEYNSDIMLKGGKEYRFPLGYDDDPDGTEIDYTQRADRRSETNYMIVVGTKEKEAFVGDVDWKSLFRWLDGIDEKKRTEWVVKGVTVGK